MSRKNILRALGVAIISAVCLTACSPEEYGACTIPNTSAYRTACRSTTVGTEGENSIVKPATCTADYVFDCDSMLCGVYQGSSPFCTRRCIPKGCNCVGQEGCLCDCPAGKTNCVDECPDGAACVEWVAGSGGYFCLPEDKGCKDDFDYSSLGANRINPPICTNSSN